MRSKGELKLESILDSAGALYVTEKTFPDLKGGLFRFDFCLLGYNTPILIEYNGEQHYHQVKHFHKQLRDFQRTQEHDRRKISWALAKGYPLYIIPYWELDRINSLPDLLSNRFRATSRWHNDREWTKKKDR